jgi:hypothetical protein
VAAQFHFWEYINGSQTFIMDSHQPFICSAATEFQDDPKHLIFQKKEINSINILHK